MNSAVSRNIRHRIRLALFVIGCVLLLPARAAETNPPPAKSATLPPLVLLADDDYPPMAYLEEGVARGMDVDFGHALAGRMRREIRVKLIDWHRAQEKVLRGEADALLGMSESAERRKLFDFSRPMFTRQFGLLVRSSNQVIHDLRTLPGHTVGVTPGGFPGQFLKQQSGITFAVITNYQDGLHQLVAGKIDALAADLWVATYLMEKGNIHGVMVVGRPFATANTAIAVKKGNTALLAEINQAINLLYADGTVDKIRQDWRPQEMMFLSREKMQHQLALAAGILLVVLFTAMGLWIFTLRKQVRIRRRAVSALQESEARYRNLTEAAFEGVGISENGIVIDANDQLLKMLGYTRAEFIGLKVLDMVVPETRAIVADAIRGEQESNYEHRLFCKDGSVLAAEIRVKLVRIGSRALRMTAVRDVTERRKSELALLRSEELFRAIVEDQTEMIVRWKPDGTRTFVNAAYCRTFGGTREQFVGSSFFPLVSELDREAVLARIRILTPERPVSTATHRSIGPGGEILWQEWTDRALFDEQGRVVELQSTGRDITARVQAEAALREAQANELRVQAQFSRRLLTAQEQERHRLANELHDGLAQNLSVIKNRAHLARQSPDLPPLVLSHLDAIERVVSTAITETRSLAHNLRPPHIDQLGLTDSLQSLIREVSQASPIRFERRLENVDDLFKGDAATNLYRIVQEALNNLVKHSKAEEASVTLERDVRSARLRVADNGVGFDRDDVRSRHGLGLTSMTERVRMLGGHLALQSAPGHGTQLTIELPFAETP